MSRELNVDAFLDVAPAAARLVLNFNYCPAEYLHYSRRDQFNIGQLNEYVWKTKRALPAISAYILEQLHLQEKICLDLSYQVWSIALLNPARMKRLQLYVIAVLYEEAIRRCLHSDDVLRWRSFLGDDAYKFALTGTKLLPNLQIKSYSDVNDAVAVSGSWMYAALSNAPEAISARAKLKIPLLKNPERVDPLQAYRLVASLLSLLEPKWYSYFLTISSR